jgi:hypothetical protein
VGVRRSQISSTQFHFAANMANNDVRDMSEDIGRESTSSDEGSLSEEEVRTLLKTLFGDASTICLTHCERLIG